MLRLDERLRAIEDLAPACRCFADIGCDHGRLGAQMLLSGRAQRVWFTDISAPSIEKARVEATIVAMFSKQAGYGTCLLTSFFVLFTTCFNVF